MNEPGDAVRAEPAVFGHANPTSDFALASDVAPDRAPQFASDSLDGGELFRGHENERRRTLYRNAGRHEPWTERANVDRITPNAVNAARTSTASGQEFGAQCR